MNERLDNIKNKYNELTLELTKPEVLSDFNKLKKLSKEQKDLEEIVLKYDEYKRCEQDIKEAKELINDPEMHDFIIEELSEKEEKLPIIEKELELLLLPKDPNDSKDIIMEIRGAAGGDEANIFAGDLFRMYSKYVEKQGWSLEILHEVPGAAGGYAQIECLIKGDNVYSKLKFESGSHRVQRVPETESGGRVHTSTATVAVMPEVDIEDIEIKDTDLKIDVYHSSGAGGQSVNTSNSAVRITHLPTKTVVTCQVERSQLKNKELAMKMLKSKLYQLEISKQEEQLSSVKGDTMDINFGSQIRNYVLEPYKLVKDLRSNYETSNTDKVLDGDIMPIIESVLKK